MYSITSRLSILRTEFIFNEKLKCQKIQKMQLPDIDFYHTVILLLWVKKWDMLYAWRIFFMLLTTLPHCGPCQLFMCKMCNWTEFDHSLLPSNCTQYHTFSNEMAPPSIWPCLMDFSPNELKIIAKVLSQCQFTPLGLPVILFDWPWFRPDPNIWSKI